MSTWKATLSGNHPENGFTTGSVDIPNLERLTTFLLDAADDGFLPSGVVNAQALGVEAGLVGLNVDEPFTLLPTDESWGHPHDIVIEVEPQ